MSSEIIFKPNGEKLTVDSETYLNKVKEFEDDGYTTSDAQAAADAHFIALHSAQ